MNTIKKHPYIVEHKVGKINSLHFVQGHTKQMINLESKTALAMFPSFLIAKKDFSRVNGYHMGGTTGLTNSGISLNRHDLAKTIIHEAGHNKLGEHTCGKWADADQNGPYGLGAYFMVSQYWNAKMQHANGRPAKYKPDMTLGEGTLALSSAYDIAKNRFCSNQSAAQKVYTYLPKSNI